MVMKNETILEYTPVLLFDVSNIGKWFSMKSRKLTLEMNLEIKLAVPPKEVKNFPVKSIFT